MDRKQSIHGSNRSVKRRMNGSNVFASRSLVFHRRIPIGKLNNQTIKIPIPEEK